MGARVSFLKGIGILGVVAHHLANRRFPEPERHAIALIGDYAHWCVPLFIGLAGLLQGYFKESPNSLQSVGDFILHRARRLLLPQLIIALVYSLLFCFLSSRGGTGGGQQEWGIGYWLATFVGKGVGEQLYFIPALFLISILSCALVAFISEPLLLGGSYVALGAACFLPASAWPDSQGFLILATPYFVASLSVYLIALLQAKKQGAWTFFIPAALCVLDAFIPSASQWPVLFALVLISVAPRIPFPIENTAGRWLGAAGEASGTIFLYHTPFLLNPLLMLVAARCPRGFLVAAAYLCGLAVVVLLTLAHRGLKGTRAGFVLM